jgi:hypothetical protein
LKTSSKKLAPVTLLFSGIALIAILGSCKPSTSAQTENSTPVQTGTDAEATQSPAPTATAATAAAESTPAASGTSMPATAESSPAATGTSAPASNNSTPAESGTSNHAAISIHFAGDDPEYALLPEDLAGAVAAQNWNNTALTSGTIDGLKDSAGKPTGASVIFTSGGSLHDSNRSGSPFEKLYHSWLNAIYSGYPPSEARVTAYFSGIPYQKYDLYVYAFTIGGGADTYVYQGPENVLIGPNKRPYTGDSPKTSVYTEGENYVKFTGLTGADQFIVISNSTNSAGPLNTEVSGIEIVDTTGSPAPATLPPATTGSGAAAAPAAN